jgi:hypothetical protein
LSSSHVYVSGSEDWFSAKEPGDEPSGGNPETFGFVDRDDGIAGDEMKKRGTYEENGN